MPKRRLAIFAVVILVLVVLAVVLTPAPRGPDLAPSRADAAADAGVTASIDPGTPQRKRTIVARVGQRVQITVTNDALDTVELADLRQRAVEAGIPARLDVTAPAVGNYPITLTGSDERIGVLSVRP